MRMRKKKHGKERLEACASVLLNKPTAPLSSPSTQAFGKEGRVFLEIGAGKGGFAIGMTEAHSDAYYFAMERVADCVTLAAEKAVQSPDATARLKFVVDTADNLKEWFMDGTVDRIFLNFSDPWPKKGHAKRRLTYRKYLKTYIELLKVGGTLTFKTDNVGLFDFSLEEIADMGLTLDKMTRDLHASEYNVGNVMTEYETAFSSQGIKICMLEFTKTADYVIPLDRLEKKKKDTNEE